MRAALRRTPRVRVAENGSVWPAVRELEPAALLIDVEPFVAPWRSDESALTNGLREQLAACAGIESVKSVLFVTNSRRVAGGGLPPTALPAGYISHARKPFLKLARLGRPEQPVVVLGDQVLTDGLMAWRLGATFVQVPLPPGASAAVRAQALVGRMASGFFFRTSTAAG